MNKILKVNMYKKNSSLNEENGLNFVSSKYLQKHHLLSSLKDLNACFSSLSLFIDFTRKTSTRSFARKDDLCV